MGSLHRHKHVHRSGAASHPLPSRAVVGLLVAALGASATLTGSASATTGVGPGRWSALGADEEPQRVLQSVSVDVAPDGSLTAVDATSVSKTDDSDLTSSEDSFVPAEVAGELPVRVLTSYRLGDRSGTDLSDIVGESGRVVVEVVVQNTTVRPQELTYDVGSTQRSQFALVGAPLTVVATAGLGGSGLTSVVTDDGTNADGPVTNGVLSRTEDDEIEVQWASMLAPPRLSPSVTFRLVQETDAFEVPTFDINVQPGLVTDTSVQRLLEAAFSDDAGSSLQLESRTISLVGQVTGALEVASDGLTDIEQLLDTSARTIGQRTIADLSGSSERITAELSGLAGDLDGLDADIEAQLRSTESSTLRQLGSTVEAIKQRLGNPATTATPPPVAVTECRFDFSRDVFGDDATVFAQLLRVRSQLIAIGDASRRCADDLTEELRAAIGSTDPGYVCEPGSVALICALGATRDDITQQAADLSTLGTTVAGRFEEDRLQRLRSSLNQVNATVGAIEDDAQQLATGEDLTGPLVDRLEAIQDGLGSLQLALDPSSAGGIPESLQSINDRARTALDALGAAGAGSSVADQARAAATAACALVVTDPPVDPPVDPPLDLPVDPLALDAISVLLTGATCAGDEVDVPGPYGGLSVAGRADVALTALGEIADLSDLSDPANPLNTTLQNLQGEVSDLLGLVVSVALNDAPGLRRRVQVLADRISTLGVGVEALPVVGTTCPGEGSGTEDDLTALNRSFRQLFCRQTGLEELITEGFGDAGTVLDQVGTDLAAGQDSADAARTAARDAVTDTTAALSTRLERAGSVLRTRGAREIAAQRRRLDAEVATVTRLLGQNITSAVQLIDTRVRTANGNLDESQRRLVADLARVLTDIGGPGGTGLLGALASGASQTRLSNESIVRVSDTAGAFGNVRSAALEDTLLQQAQLARSLELQQELPPFGTTLPPGSRHVSVYSFHLGED